MRKTRVHFRFGTKLAITDAWRRWAYYNLEVNLEDFPERAVAAVTVVKEGGVLFTLVDSQAGAYAPFHLAKSMHFYSKTVKREQREARKEAVERIKKNITDRIIREYANKNGIEFPE